MPEDHPITNYNQITANIYLGTNLCCMLHSQILDNEKFDCEIDLEGEKDDLHPRTNIYLRLPTPDMLSPSVSQLQAGVALLAEMVRQNKKVYVHCRYGHGRSPELVAAYFMSLGLSMEAAIAKVKEKRPEIHLDDQQILGLKSYSDSLTSDILF
ncbi:MAG TPA: dual specificity protein phosphatase family protein [Candidatus Saccharimonadales bacterium]|nr:dual specificity protein phosphatase family protein [Candidatus Saccharimonadales bacterium]